MYCVICEIYLETNWCYLYTADSDLLFSEAFTLASTLNSRAVYYCPDVRFVIACQK